jgi:hypothetical protein
MRNLYRLAVLMAVVVMAGPFAAQASDHYGPRRDGHDDRGKTRVLKIALWGDEFYADDPETKASMVDQTIDSMNKHGLDFTIFAGDTKNGSSQCTDQAIGQDIIDIFNRLRAPTLYTLGDNEWTDCHRTSNGSYDPVERLSYLRQTFFDRNLTQGRDPIVVERQGQPGEAYSENSRFVMSKVEFVALNVPGSNNNLVATEKQCTNKSDRSQADCDAATAEYMARNEQDIAWLRDSFEKARLNHYAGILIDIQADIYAPIELSDGGYTDSFLPTLDENNGYTAFFNALVEETHDFSGQVLLVHGDSHYFRIDKAMVDADGRTTSNFTRVEVFGSSDNSWVEMTVDPKSANVFSFVPVVLGTN